MAGDQPALGAPSPRALAAARAAGADRQLTGAAIGHFLLFYHFVPDYLERRPQHRDLHLRLAWEAQKRGELVLAGALADPVDSAMLLFEGSDKAVAEEFARADPYVRSGLVESWQVREWTTVVGEAAATPVRPAD